MTYTILDTALAYADMGIPVFPLRSNKRPCTDGGFKVATKDAATIKRLFSNPAAMLIGIPTGSASGFDVLDIDPKSGGDEWLREHRHEIPATHTSHTQSGGVHFRFRHVPGMANSASRIAPGVDVRGEGGYVVAWEAHGLHSTGGAVADWPAWLLISALRKSNPNTPAPDAETLAPPDAATLIALIEATPNPDTVTRDDYTAFNLAIQGCVRGLEALGREVDPSAVYDAAAEWSARWDGPEPATFEFERGVWDSDWSTRDRDISGWRQVVGLAGKFGADVSAHVLAAAAAEFSALPPEPESAAPVAAAPVAAEPSVNESNERAVARGFAKDMAAGLRYDHSLGAWFVWHETAGVWRRDQKARVFAMIDEYIHRTRALFGGTDKAMAGYAFVSAVEKFLRFHPAVAIEGGEWDTDPWLLGVPGGVIDLRTGELLPADPARLMTKQTAVAPSAPGTPAPLWDWFLRQASGGDQTFTDYLQRLSGYCLTGDVSEEMFGFAYGQGGAGKGTYFGTSQRVLADYGLQMGMDVFASDSKTNQEYARAKMVGARMIMASETKIGSTWNEAGLKEYSGNEGSLSAREPYGKIFNFQLQAKIILIGNNAPKLAGEASSMQRRLHVIPFDCVAEVRDLRLKDNLRAEYPQILRWFIDGCAAWQRSGLGTCAKVQAASAHYFEEQNAIQVWANERLEIGAGCRVKRADLFADFATCCRANGETTPASHAFYESARRALNLTDKKDRTGVRMLIGAAIRTESEVFPKAEDSDFEQMIH